MKSLEVGYCAFEEYSTGESERVMESEIAEGELYTIMLALPDTERPAIKYPFLARNVIRMRDGKVSVSFTTFNGELRPLIEQIGVFRNGYLVPENTESIPAHGLHTKIGYLKEFSIDWDKVFQKILNLDKRPLDSN